MFVHIKVGDPARAQWLIVQTSKGPKIKITKTHKTGTSDAVYMTDFLYLLSQARSAVERMRELGALTTEEWVAERKGSDSDNEIDPF